jgi:septal ring factor EnvC (AmiA/AmiB activator)
MAETGGIVKRVLVKQLQPVKDDIAKIDTHVKSILDQLNKIETRVKALSDQLTTIEEAVKQKAKA